MANDTMNLNDSVAAAVKEHVTEPIVEEKKVETEVKEEVKEESEKVEEKKEVKTEQLAKDLSPEEVDKQRNALILYESLLNPEKRKSVVEYLVREVGLDPTKTGDIKTTKKSTAEFLKEKLGPIYGDMAEVLGPAFDELLEAKTTEKLKPVEEKLRLDAERVAAQQADTAMESFFARNKISKADQPDVEKKMMNKINQMPASGNITIEEYLDDIYHIVSRGKSETKIVKETVDKINRNAKEASRTSGVEIDESRIKKGSHIPTLKEAVEAAMRGERLE